MNFSFVSREASEAHFSAVGISVLSFRIKTLHIERRGVIFRFLAYNYNKIMVTTHDCDLTYVNSTLQTGFHHPITFML